MALSDFIKKNNTSNESAVQVFEKNEQLYKGKSDNFIIRVSADELGMRADDLRQVLEEHYNVD